MTRLLAIPVAGTVAALLAILAFHGEREAPKGAGPALREPPPFEFPTPDDLPDDADDETVKDEPEDEAGAPPLPPPPKPRTYRLQLRADGALVDMDSGESFKDAAEVLETLAADARVRHTVMVGNATPEVAEEAVDAVVKALSKRCEVRKVYRGPSDEGG